MRIVLARGPGVLTVEDAEQPEPGPGELLVAVTAAGVSLPVVRAVAAPVPDGIEDGAAVALLRNGQVALGALRAGRCAAGDRVLVTAAAGGVGHLAVQLARELGASRVIAAIRSPAGSLGDGPGGPGDRAAFLRELGADEVVSYADAARAHDLVRSRRTFGKVVLFPRVNTRE